jgi:hypothetical protein
LIFNFEFAGGENWAGNYIYPQVSDRPVVRAEMNIPTLHSLPSLPFSPIAASTAAMDQLQVHGYSWGCSLPDFGAKVAP